MNLFQILTSIMILLACLVFVVGAIMFACGKSKADGDAAAERFFTGPGPTPAPGQEASTRAAAKRHLALTVLLCLGFLWIVATATGAEIQWQPCDIQANGHTLKIGFRSDITTNDVGYWNLKSERMNMMTLNYISITNYAGDYQRPQEKPFPRTNLNEAHWEVYSNTYAMAVCDGNTNTLSESHVKLGDYFKKESTVIVTSTNTVSTESFTPVGK